MNFDFNTSAMRNKNINGELNALLDNLNQAGENRGYLGASQIGEECLRKIQFQLNDPAPHFEPRTKRIFERGHVYEDVAAKWLRDMGFDLQTHKPDGGQLGFKSAGGKYSGHIDGIIKETPTALKVPCIWECKALGAKGFKNVSDNGVAVAYPQYAAQISQYQAYLSFHNPALFMAINMDTMHVYFELIKFNAKLAQRITDKAVQIIEAQEHGEILPRAYPSADFYKCKWCSYSDECWK